MNEEQKHIAKLVEEGQSVFLTAGRLTGVTTLITYLKSRNRRRLYYCNAAQRVLPSAVESFDICIIDNADQITVDQVGYLRDYSRASIAVLAIVQQQDIDHEVNPTDQLLRLMPHYRKMSLQNNMRLSLQSDVQALLQKVQQLPNVFFDASDFSKLLSHAEGYALRSGDVAYLTCTAQGHWGWSSVATGDERLKVKPDRSIEVVTPDTNFDNMLSRARMYAEKEQTACFLYVTERGTWDYAASPAPAPLIPSMTLIIKPSGEVEIRDTRPDLSMLTEVPCDHKMETDGNYLLYSTKTKRLTSVRYFDHGPDLFESGVECWLDGQYLSWAMQHIPKEMKLYMFNTCK